MILMQIFAEMREDDVRSHFAFELLEALLDLRAAIREKAVLELLDEDGFSSNPAEKLRGAVLGLARTYDIGAEDDPIHVHVGAFFGETEHRSAATYLYIVAVGAQAKDRPKGSGKKADHEALLSGLGGRPGGIADPTVQVASVQSARSARDKGFWGSSPGDIFRTSRRSNPGIRRPQAAASIPTQESFCSYPGAGNRLRADASRYPRPRSPCPATCRSDAQPSPAPRECLPEGVRNSRDPNISHLPHRASPPTSYIPLGNRERTAMGVSPAGCG